MTSWLTLSCLLVSCGTIQNKEPENGEAPPGVVVRVTGVGLPPKDAAGPQAKLMARRAAEVVARRNLLAAVQGARVTDHGDRVMETVEGVIRGYRLSEPRYLPDGSVEIDAELPLVQVHANFVEYGHRLTTVEAQLKEAQAALTRTADELERARQELTHAAMELDELRTRFTRLTEWAKQRLAALRNELDELQTLVTPEGAVPAAVEPQR